MRPVDQDEDRLLTVKEVSEKLHISESTLRNWRMRWPSERQGPPSFKVGGTVRYRKADVQAWIDRALAAEGVA